MNENLIEPVDPIHAMCMQAVLQIRERAVDAKMRVAVWEPRPMPASYVIRGARGSRSGR
jgi:hypothetical protein